MKKIYIFLVLWFFSCAVSALTLPEGWQDKMEVLPESDPDYASADLPGAVQPEGKGGISEGLVVRLKEDMPAYRMWNGPGKVDSNGYTNRLGRWWTFDAPSGTQAQYRVDYDICVGWNDLTWVAACTLKAGAVVAVGPGQSVSAETCGDPSGNESYPASPDHWQTWVASPWSSDSPLQCPPDSDDYKADPDNLAEPAGLD